MADDPTRAKTVCMEWIPVTQVAKASAVVDALAESKVLDLDFPFQNGAESSDLQ